MGIRDRNALQMDCQNEHNKCFMKKFKLRHTVNDVYIVTETKNQNEGWLEIHRKPKLKCTRVNKKNAKTFIEMYEGQ